MRILRANHPSLYQRLIDLIWLKIGLAVALIFSPPLQVTTVRATDLATLLSLKFWGAIFLILGIGLYVSLTMPHKTYHRTKWLLLASFGYDLLWLVSLVLSIATVGVRSAPIAVLWGYFTVNVYRMAVDPGWETVSLLDRVEENASS